MKNLLTLWEIEEKNQKIIGNVPLIDRKVRVLQNQKIMLNVYFFQSS